jgi:hypothetical protein
VAMLSSWGFGYYWPHGHPVRRHVTSNLQQFVVVYPNQPRILVATDRTRAAVDAVLNRAAGLLAGRGHSARIWVLHQHESATELQAYQDAAVRLGFSSEMVVPGSLVVLIRPTAG